MKVEVDIKILEKYLPEDVLLKIMEAEIAELDEFLESTKGGKK